MNPKGSEMNFKWLLVKQLCCWTVQSLEPSAVLTDAMLPLHLKYASPSAAQRDPLYHKYSHFMNYLKQLAYVKGRG